MKAWKQQKSWMKIPQLWDANAQKSDWNQLLAIIVIIRLNHCSGMPNGAHVSSHGSINFRCQRLSDTKSIGDENFRLIIALLFVRLSTSISRPLSSTKERVIWRRLMKVIAQSRPRLTRSLLLRRSQQPMRWDFKHFMAHLREEHEHERRTRRRKEKKIV